MDQNRLIKNQIKFEKRKYLFLLDYYDNHPLGIIYDWIRSKPAKETIILKHLDYLPYCKSGKYKLSKDNFLKVFYKFIRIHSILTYLKSIGYKIIDIDKLTKQDLSLDEIKSKVTVPGIIENEIIRDFICQKDRQSSYLSIRKNHIFKDYQSSTKILWKKYIKIIKNLSIEYNIDSSYIFNGRALRQKLISNLLRENKIDVFYIERNMWNKGRTIKTKERVQSFGYLSTDQCLDYGSSYTDINVEELFENVMKKSWSKMQVDSFNRESSKQKLISYMSGSSDEYLAFTNEVMLDNCSSQIKLVDFISRNCLKNGIDFVLRVHPNTRNKSDLDIDFWNSIGRVIESRGHNFFSATSNINTYSIINESDAIITISSTVAVESCLQGKNVCLCGFSGLRKYNAALIPTMLEEIKEFILERNPDRAPSEVIKAAKRYLSDELQSGRTLSHYSMDKERFYL